MCLLPGKNMNEKTKQLLETINNLAEEIVGIEPEDLQELARIHAHFQTITDFNILSERDAGLANRCADKIEGIILNELDDPDTEIARVNQAVASLQEIVECLNRGQSTEACWLPDWFADLEGIVTTKSVDQAFQAGAEYDEVPVDADGPLLQEFFTESIDHIRNAEAALLDMESNSDPEKINEIFRAFHTIKGTAGFLGLDCINKLAHKAETLLDQVRRGEIDLAGSYADLAFDSCDMLKTLIEYLKAVMEGTTPEEPSGLNTLLMRLEHPDAEASQKLPRISDLLVAEGKVSREVLEDVLNDKSAVGPIGERLVEKAIVQAKDVAQALRTQQAARAKLMSESSVRVSTSRLDTLVNMVGELVIAQSMVAQDRVVRDSDSQLLARNITQLDKITRELQELGLSMRMVPLKHTFQKMARLVRDLSKKSGKRVTLVTEGEDTEIDRNMVEAINDPLVHLMRNAVDHGIEASNERVAASKAPNGVITLRASHTAGSVVIEIIDDGRGLDKDAIFARAKERGLIENGREKEMSESDIYNLILQPGFSTAKTVTGVSGRGVGMDVVKRNVEDLRGKLEIVSEMGVGSVFLMRLPLTLAIIDGMLLHVGSERYILATTTIREAIRPKPEMISTIKNKGEMVMIRGKLVPIIRLHKLFGVQDANQNVNEGLLVIIEVDGKLCALLIDEIVGQQQVVIKSLGAALGKVPGVSGGAILGDGKVGLILDAASLISFAQKSLVGHENVASEQFAEITVADDEGSNALISMQ